MPIGKRAEGLRHRIDRGETGDKVPASDPAAVPLGTDDEAGGAPPGGAAVEAALADAAGPGRPRAPSGQAAHAGPSRRRPPWGLLALIVAAFAVGVVAAVALMP